MANPQIREAAESLYGSFSQQQQQQCNRIPSCSSQSHSINLITEDLVLGHRINGRMSTVRRFFCLFVTFDLLFTVLMWLICVMMTGQEIIDILTKEILHYSIKTSVFDVVMGAACRFTVLLLFYALLYINHWIVIALSTGGTCAFLIGKVFIFDWQQSPQPVFHVLLILTSFTISWGEAWFLDFRVLPQEIQAKQILGALSSYFRDPAREPLLGASSQQPSARSTAVESVADYFSPFDTPVHTPGPRRGQCILTQDMIDEYKINGATILAQSWSLLHRTGWALEKQGKHGDIVESLHTKEFGKVFRFTGVVDCPASFLFEEIRDKIDEFPSWNPTIIESKCIKKIVPGLDLSYQVTAGGGRGMIKERDFVTLRRCVVVDENGTPVELPGEEVPARAHAYISAGVSVECPGYPPKQTLVRGENKVSCWCMKPTMIKTPAGQIKEKCLFQWLMCVNLKGKIPQFILDTAFSTVMHDYIAYIRKFSTDKKKQGAF